MTALAPAYAWTGDLGAGYIFPRRLARRKALRVFVPRMRKIDSACRGERGGLG